MINQSSTLKRALFLLAVYILPVAVLDVLLAVQIAFNPKVPWLSDLGTGWGLGQLLIVLALLAFHGRTWIAGWLTFSLLVYLVGAVYQLFQPVENRYKALEYLIGFTAVQFGLLGCFLPLVVLRSLRGWMWSAPGQTVRLWQPIKVEDWFLLSFVLCSSLALTRIAEARLAQPSPSTELSELGGAMLMVSITVVPLYAISFAQQSPIRLLAKWLAVSAIVTGVVALGMYGEGTTKDFPRFLIAAAGFAPAFAWGTYSILGAGWRIVRVNQATVQETTVSGADPQPSIESHQIASGRRQARVATAVVAVLTATGLGIHQTDESRQLAFYRAIEDPANYYRAAVESVDLRGTKIVGVTMSPTATDNDLRQVVKSTPQIERLVLANTQVTDDSLSILNELTKLKYLDLSHTRITGLGLKRLPMYVEGLSLSHTSIDFQAIVEYCYSANRWLKDLDLSFTTLDDSQLRLLKDAELGLIWLSLAGNPITDEGIATMLDNSSDIYHLDVSDTHTLGEFLDREDCPQSVVLDGTKITDQTLLSAVSNPNRQWQSLSLRRTQITPAVLPAMSGKGVSLGLGEGLIAEQDLSALSSGSFSKLALNSPEFTGESLTTGSVAAAVIDLSHSSITDDIATKIVTQSNIYSLDLSHTQVTEQTIARMESYEVLVHGAQVDIASLFKTHPRSLRIVVRHEELTPEQLIRTKRMGVVIDEGSMFEYRP